MSKQENNHMENASDSFCRAAGSFSFATALLCAAGFTGFNDYQLLCATTSLGAVSSVFIGTADIFNGFANLKAATPEEARNFLEKEREKKQTSAPKPATPNAR